MIDNAMYKTFHLNCFLKIYIYLFAFVGVTCEAAGRKLKLERHSMMLYCVTIFVLITSGRWIDEDSPNDVYESLLDSLLC